MIKLFLVSLLFVSPTFLSAFFIPSSSFSSSLELASFHDPKQFKNTRNSFQKFSKNVSANRNGILVGLPVNQVQNRCGISGNNRFQRGRILKYSDEAVEGTRNLLVNGTIGFSIVAISMTFVALYFSGVLNKKAFTFDLEEDEIEAVNNVTNIFDPSEEDQVLLEKGTVGETRRKKEALMAKQEYQKGKDPREVRDKTLGYAEIDMSYLAVLLRTCRPSDNGNEVFVDLGSGMGKGVFAAGMLYKWKKAIGIEFLPGLHKRANAFASRYKSARGKSPVEFQNKDFTDTSVSKTIQNADVLFAYGKFQQSDLQGALSNSKIGAKIITIDKTLKGKEFKLIKEIDDPRGDLQLMRGYVYERVM